MTDLIALHRGVLETTVAIANQVTDADLDKETPCTDWNLRALLAHMIGQNYGFAAAAEAATRHATEGATQHTTEDAKPDAAAFAPRPLGPDPAADHAASAARVIYAFADPALLDSSVYLAEVRAGATFPGRVVVGFHLVDCVAHGWDIAKTLGIEAVFGDDALRAALAVSVRIPAEAKTNDEFTPFGPNVDTTSATLLDQVVAALGRSPGWTPARLEERA